METQFLAAMILGLSAVGAHAGGLDRSGQPIGIIFEEGNVYNSRQAFRTRLWTVSILLRLQMAMSHSHFRHMVW